MESSNQNISSIPASHVAIFAAFEAVRARLEAAGVHSKVMPFTHHARAADNWPNSFGMVTYRGEIPRGGDVSEEQKPVAAMWLMRLKTGLFSKERSLEVEGHSTHRKLRFRFNNATDAGELAAAIIDETNTAGRAFKTNESEKKARQQNVESCFPDR